MQAVKRAKLVKWLGGVILGVALVVAAGWLAFVPSAREPGYAFVMAWGGPGNGPGRCDRSGQYPGGSQLRQRFEDAQQCIHLRGTFDHLNFTEYRNRVGRDIRNDYGERI